MGSRSLTDFANLLRYPHCRSGIVYLARHLIIKHRKARQPGAVIDLVVVGKSSDSRFDGCELRARDYRVVTAQ